MIKNEKNELVCVTDKINSSIKINNSIIQFPFYNIEKNLITPI